MKAEDIVVFDAKTPDRNWWAAKCKHCGTFLTKYDFTAETALYNAQSSNHECRGAS